ncbi:hypothetical protein ACFFGT_21380 [Mucilaginibacter angelicae]|uniref:MAPEG family protein n=1 Tax=Mucilaginibacter angelicae TaxID=869718 RepID=A0ABV6LBE8_9SPHI
MKVFNDLVLQLYLGGLMSLLFAVTIVWVKQALKRSFERTRLKDLAMNNPEEVGDIEAKLNDSYDFRKINFFEELVIWGVQPLFIIAFINLFTISGELEIIIAFLFVIFTLCHEFDFADRFSKSIFYAIVIIALWIVTFFVFSIRTNQKDINEKTIIENKNKADSILRVNPSLPKGLNK